MADTFFGALQPPQNDKKNWIRFHLYNLEVSKLAER